MQGPVLWRGPTAWDPAGRAPAWSLAASVGTTEHGSGETSVGGFGKSR